MIGIKALAQRVLNKQPFQPDSNEHSNIGIADSNILSPIELECWKNDQAIVDKAVNHATYSDSNPIGKTVGKVGVIPIPHSKGIPTDIPTISRHDVEHQYPELLTLHDGKQVCREDVLDCALKTEDDPLGLGDWPDLMKPECMMAFASSLLMTNYISELRS